MAGWSNFFVGELGAAAALAGLLFVSVSVNQARILELGRMADRGLEALGLLFLVMVVASLPLIPGQPPRLLGGEILAIALTALGLIVPLQRLYLAGVPAEHLPRSQNMVNLNRLAVVTIAASGAAILARADLAGLYVLAPGILITFVAVGINAWVLLIEINR
jgi:modulator of FtsH protease